MRTIYAFLGKFVLVGVTGALGMRRVKADDLRLEIALDILFWKMLKVIKFFMKNTKNY